MAQERVGQMRRAADPLDALVGLVDHVGQGRATAGLRRSRDSSHSSETPHHEPAPHGGVDPGRSAHSGRMHTRTYGAYPGL
jgi:hypothetical protein